MSADEKSTMRHVAEDFIDYLATRHMFESGITVYVDGGRIDCEKYNSQSVKCRTENKTVYYFTPDFLCTCRYANEETLTATFEGAFNHALNYSDYARTDSDLCKILEPYGLYYEQGYAWSFTLYES